MYTKILIVSLLQAGIAEDMLTASSVRRNINSGRRPYTRDPGNGHVQLHDQDLQLQTMNYGPYSERNQQHLYPHGNHRPSNVESTAIEPSSSHTNKQGTSQYSEEGNLHDESHVGGNVRNDDRRYRRVMINRNKTGSRASDEQDTLNTNLNSRPKYNTWRSRSELTTADHNATHSRHQSTVQEQVRTNKMSTGNPDTTTSTNKFDGVNGIIKTNPNINVRVADTEPATANLALRNISNGVISSDGDNLERDTSVKGTTENDIKVKYSKSVTNDNNEDRWVWDSVPPVTITTTTTTVKNIILPSGGIDDRTVLNGDGCPMGEAKVKGMCIEKH